LLNTAEAARFLRVSQASIRRWSDTGLLPSRRVGRRRERRFSESELFAFMNISLSSARGVPGVIVAGAPAAVPVHLGTLFSTDAGGLRVTVPFLADGVRLRQPTFLVASGEVLERYARAIDLRLLTVATEFAGRRSHEVIAQWEQRFADVLAGGPTVIRIVREMAQGRSTFASDEELFRYEADFELMSRRYPLAAICQYDVRLSTGVALLQALKAHPDLFDFRSAAFL
jgi:transcriptional repressor of dcmA and dcmR